MVFCMSITDSTLTSAPLKRILKAIMVEQIITIGHFIVNTLREGDQWDVGDVVAYVAKLFPRLFNSLHIKDGHCQCVLA